MKNVVTLSGWGQPHDALDIIAPGANHINYHNFDDVDNFLKSLKSTNCDTLIGWSLGGQLALRAISSGVLKPKKLVLIAPPFQFVSGRGMKCGMDIDTFNAFDNNFATSPGKILKKFAFLVAKNDSKIKEVAKSLQEQKITNIEKWEYWLEELGRFSCQKLDFSKIPDTVVIHGMGDTIVDITQVGLFRPLIANCKIEMLENCGHAPHLHDTERVKELIKTTAKEAA